jgi:hypothetical protein
LSEIGVCNYIKTRKGYKIFLNDTLIAIVCNQFLYMKMTLEGRALLDRPVILPPYIGAVYHIRISDVKNFSDWVQLAEITYKSLSKMPR